MVYVYELFNILLSFVCVLLFVMTVSAIFFNSNLEKNDRVNPGAALYLYMTLTTTVVAIGSFVMPLVKRLYF